MIAAWIEYVVACLFIIGMLSLLLLALEDE